MRTYYLERKQWVPASLEKVFSFFSRPENLQKLTPPWLDFRIVEAPAELSAGALIRYRLRVHGVPVGWLTAIREWDPPHRFVDEQLRGPYALWHHTHTFEPHPDADGDTLMRDVVRYALPLGPPPEPFSAPMGPRCRWRHTDSPGASSGPCEQLAGPGLPYCALHWVQHVMQRQRLG